MTSESKSATLDPSTGLTVFFTRAIDLQSKANSRLISTTKATKETKTQVTKKYLNEHNDIEEASKTMNPRKRQPSQQSNPRSTSSEAATN
jgi:hypothetical protein